MIDYFEPLENEEKGALSKMGGAVFKGTMGLAHRLRRDVPAIHIEDIRYDELGIVTFTGFISKRRGN
jgi:hypothetical protein